MGVGLAAGRGRQAGCRRRAPAKPHQRERSSGAGRPAPPHPSPGFQRAGRLERPAQPQAPGSRAHGPSAERPPRHAARPSGSPSARPLPRYPISGRAAPPAAQPLLAQQEQPPEQGPTRPSCCFTLSSPSKQHNCFSTAFCKRAVEFLIRSKGTIMHLAALQFLCVSVAG